MQQALPEYKEHIGSCKECGNSPVNHSAMFIAQTINVWMGFRLKGTGSHMHSRMMHWMHALMDRLTPLFFRFAEAVELVSLDDEPTRAHTYRSQVIWEEAQKRGISMRQIVIFGSYTDMYRAEINGRRIYFDSLPIPRQREEEYAGISDKFLLKEALSAAGVPVPRAYSALSAGSALEALRQENGRYVIVKPQAGSRGRHTTTYIKTGDDMVKAFKSARALGAYVAVEQQLFGNVSRATVVGGKLVGFFTAAPPRVTGDGAATIRELVAIKNAHKHERVQEIVLNESHEDFLRRLGYSLDSIPEKGAAVDLSHRTGRLFGGETRELLDTVHPALKEYAEKAARTLHAPVVGFDLIIPDPEKDPEGQEWGIIEANSLPFIDLHYLPLYGKPSNTAAAVWDLWATGK